MGFSAVTTVLASAATFDLTDLATAKDELSIKTANTSNDTWLARAINQVSQSVASFTQRIFAPELVTEVFDIAQDPYPYQTPGGFAELQLSRWPALAVDSVAQTLAPAVTQALVVGMDFRVDNETGRLLRLNPYTGAGTTWEAIPVTVQYLAGFGARVSESGAVPASAPYQVTVTQTAAFSCDHSVSYPDGTRLARVTGPPAAGEYSVAAGVYTFNAADEGKMLAFSYATFIVPDDLEEICLRLVTARYRAKDRDPALIQRETPGVGLERWWFGGAPGQKGPFPPDIEAALLPYAMPVVA
jgi:hypothetical protein